MSQTSPFLGFSLRDTLTRLVPGLVFLTPLIVGFSVFTPDILPSESVLFILLGLSGYVIGEFIDQLRSGLFRVPFSFRYFVYRETDQIEKMPGWYIKLIEWQQRLPNGLYFYEDRSDEARLTNNMDLNFREDIESELGVDFLQNRPREIYDLLLIYMEDSQTHRLRRFQSVSMFSSNIRIAAVGGLLPYSAFAVANWPDPFFAFMLLVSGIIAILVVAL